MGADHPVSWCKDFQNGRSFYTALGNTAAAYDAQLTTHLKGAISWAAGASDPIYSDCGATVLRNYQQTKISAPPNVNEPIGFDQLPDGRIIQTARTGTVRLHDPVNGTTQVIADFGAASTPASLRLYTVSEDGLYGPAIDNNFASNKWVYLFYSPLTVTDVKTSTGALVTQTTPTTGSPPANAASKTAWDPWIGYFQLSRFKLVDGENPTLDFSSEQQIMRVPVNRGNCCHVAGDIDFDSANNLWIVTGDDNEAGGINGGGFGPFNDQLTDENQTVRVTGATAGTFTLTFNGQTTAPLPYNATATQVDEALEALSNIGANDVQAVGGPVQTANVSVYFRRGLQQANQTQLTADGAALTGGTVAAATAQEGGNYQNPIGDSRRGALNSNDLRGKVLRFKVKDNFGAADANQADFGSGTGAYTIPSGNLFPLVAGAPQAKTRAEVYAMGFRNPFRIQVDENNVAYVTDYSPDSRTPTRGRGPAGTGRVEIVRKPSNYGWPTCYSSKLGYWKWSFHEWAANIAVTPAPPVNQQGMAPNGVAEPIDCGGPTQRNDSRWVAEGGPSVEPGLQELPPVTDPDIWYSYNDNLAPNPLGTPCAAYSALTPGPIAPGSTTECPRLFPELGSGGVGPHGAAKYNYDANNPSTKKFPPYYDDTVIMGEFTRDILREVKLDGDNRVFKVNNFLDCGAANTPNPSFLFECDSPMDMQFGSDGAFYLLTYGDGFFNINPDAGMYKWEYVKGQRAPKAVLTVDRSDGPAPLTVNFSSAGSLDEDPGETIRFEWDFGDGTPLSIEANPTHTYTTPGRYTAILRVIDSSGKVTATSTPITVGNTSPTITINTPVAGGTFAFGDRIPFVVTVTDPEDRVIDCDDVQVTFVLGHDSHGHPEDTVTGCSGSLEHDRRRRLPRRQRVRRHQRPLHRPRRLGRAGPAADHGRRDADPPAQAGGRARRHAVRHQHGGHDRHRRRPASRQPGQQRLDPAQRPVQPRQHRLAHVPRGRHGGRPHRRLAAGGGRVADGLADRSDRRDLQPDVHRRHDRLVQSDVPGVAGRHERAVPRVPLGDGRPDGQQPVQPQLRRVQRQGRDGGPDVAGRADRRQRPRHAVAVAGHAGGLRGLHPGRRADLRRLHHGQRRLDCR